MLVLLQTRIIFVLDAGKLEKMLIVGFTLVVIVIFDAFGKPLTTGKELTTRIRYAAPVEVPGGISAETVPEMVEVKNPIFTGAAKEPVASLNWAVKMFPALYMPVIVYPTLIVVPAQKEADKADVVIV